MKIQSMFEKDINRPINGVVKVAQDDEESLQQELSEYIITKELRRHFSTFFDNYSKALDTPTANMGVWISGFFGSGKSHFLKILSYLLSNKEVAGKKAIDYFEDKIGDPIMYATVKKCTAVPTESIVFNIDIEGPIKKDKTAVLRVFAKVFYNHCGYYGEDLKVAQLERFIEKQGKTEEFRRVFEEVNGEPWVSTRDAYAFFEDDIVEVLQKVLGMSEAAARNWFKSEENADMSIKQLVVDIKEYVDSKGKNFRLLFMIDEVGQYIGDDSDLMINLQSLVEEIGDKCRGKVWVMVTSQEAIDSIVKITGDDFSKIQGRFNTRLSLSSSSVDEVIKKRILAKTEDADKLLRMVYEKEYPVLKNLFTFNNPVLDIKGFKDATDYSESYPFVPYQFIVIQQVLVEIRRHGNSGKHLSGGERSMLSGFQETAQDFQDRDENALVPFHKFYDTVHTFLESPIRRVIDRCQNAAENNDGIAQRDVNVLKLLYLLRYIDDNIKANVDNIAVLMIEDIRTDKIALRASITESLDRLLSQNYIARNGDTYSFLTDEEQEIASDIRNTHVDSGEIVHSVAQTIFMDIYPLKKYRYAKKDSFYDFPYDQYVDNTIFGSGSGGMCLRIVTVANDYYMASEQKYKMDSHSNNEAIVILNNETPYFEELEQAKKIRKYAKQRNVSQLPESIKDIITNRQKEATVLENRAKSNIEKAIESAKFYIHGEKVDIKAGNAKDKLDSALAILVESVYSKLYMISTFVDSDADILQILNGNYEEFGLSGTGVYNEDALHEISQWLELQNSKMLPTSMGDVQRRYGAIPYGWREIDIAALVARLIAQQKLSIRYGGAVVAKDHKRLVDYLRKRTEIDKANVTRRIAPSEDLMRKSREFLREYGGAMDIPTDEDGLIRYVLDIFEKKEAHYNELIEKEYNRERYPEKEVVIAARDLMSNILSQRRDNVALLNRMVQKQDELVDSEEDMEQIEVFFKSQRLIFDDAKALQKDIGHELDYYTTDTEAFNAINELSSILEMPKPYARIKDLPELMQKIKAVRSSFLEIKKEEVKGIIIQCMGDVHTLSGNDPRLEDIITRADDHFTKKRTEATEASSLTVLDAMITQLLNFKDTVCRRLENRIQDQNRVSEDPKAPPKPKSIVTVRRYDVFPVKRLQSKEDVDQYIEAIRKKLYDTLEDNDGIQIN